jgi:hypothetical protein
MRYAASRLPYPDGPTSNYWRDFMKTILRTLSLACAMTLPMLAAQPAAACGQDSYIGSICYVGYNWCPQGTVQAAGQLLPITQYQAVFALLGCNYGGDCRTTFAVPDLRGRSIVGYGAGPGLSQMAMGDKGGVEGVVLNAPRQGGQLSPVRHNSHPGTPSLLSGKSSGLFAGGNSWARRLQLQERRGEYRLACYREQLQRSQARPSWGSGL